MNTTAPFYTERMKFRLLTPDDADFVFRQFSDEDMCRYFSEPPCTYEEAKDIILHYQNPLGKDHLRYGMFDRATNSFIGTCGYHYWEDQRRQVEIGYDIWKEYWRQGYATEALPELINLCFNHLNVAFVYALIHPLNVASIASVRKFGFTECEPCREIDSEPQLCLKLEKAVWQSFREG